MGRASSQKKVARAATTGGGRTVGTRQPMGWYLTMVAVIALGIFLVAFSRNQELNKGQVAAKTSPALNTDSWNSAFSVYLCDHWVPSLPLDETVDGITSNGKGVIRIEPFTAGASGNHAQLGFFVKSEKFFSLSTKAIQLPKIPGDTNTADSRKWVNGDKCPNGKAGEVKFNVNGKQDKIDPNTWKFRNGDSLNLGFVPDDVTIPVNPNDATNLSAAAALSASSTPPTTPTTTPASTPPASVPVSPATTAPPTTAP